MRVSFLLQATGRRERADNFEVKVLAWFGDRALRGAGGQAAQVGPRNVVLAELISAHFDACHKTPIFGDKCHLCFGQAVR